MSPTLLTELYLNGNPITGSFDPDPMPYENNVQPENEVPT